MLYQNYCDALRTDPLNKSHEIRGLGHVETGGGFVEEQKLWRGDDRPSYFELPAMAVRQGSGHLRPVVLKAYDCQGMTTRFNDPDFFATLPGSAQQRLD